MDIETEELKKAIGLVVPGIARKETFDQADKLAFHEGSLISYNDEVSIFHPLTDSEEIDGAIDGKRLFNLLNRITSTSVNLEQGDNELIVKSGRVTARFTLSPVVLPFSEVDWTGEYQPLPEGFKKALGLVSSTCAREMSRPVLTCVYMSGEVMLGSDGYRSAQFQFDEGGLPDLLLPVTAAELLLDYEIGELAVGEHGEWVRFKTHEETVICARLSSGTYPDLSKVLDVKGDQLILPKRLTECLERAQIFAKRDHRIDEEVQINLKGNQIIVKSNYDGGRFEEVVRADQDATGVFSIHPDFLSAALSEEDAASCILSKSKIKFIGPNWEHTIGLR